MALNYIVQGQIEIQNKNLPRGEECWLLHWVCRIDGGCAQNFEFGEFGPN